MDIITIIFGTIGGFIVSGITAYVVLRKLPLDMRKSETSIAQEAYNLAQQALKDRAEDTKRIDELEKAVVDYQKKDKEKERLIALKDKRIDDLEKKVALLENMLASQRAEFEERLAFQKAEYDREILGYKTVVDDLDKQVETLKQQIGAVKRTTDELKKDK